MFLIELKILTSFSLNFPAKNMVFTMRLFWWILTIVIIIYSYCYASQSIFPTLKTLFHLVLITEKKTRQILSRAQLEEPKNCEPQLLKMTRKKEEMTSDDDITIVCKKTQREKKIHDQCEERRKKK